MLTRYVVSELNVEAEGASHSLQGSTRRTKAGLTAEAQCLPPDLSLSIALPFSLIFPVPSPLVTAAALSMCFLVRARSA